MVSSGPLRYPPFLFHSFFHLQHRTDHSVINLKNENQSDHRKDEKNNIYCGVSPPNIKSCRNHLKTASEDLADDGIDYPVCRRIIPSSKQCSDHRRHKVRNTAKAEKIERPDHMRACADHL